MLEKNSDHEEFIIFRVGDQEFCIEMGLTRELRGWTPATAMPNSADYLVGIINLRGNIIPIVDLAKRLGLNASKRNERNVIIVVQLKEKQFGIQVDAVSDIVSIGPDDIRPVPNLNSALADEFFKQVIVQDRRIVCQIMLEQLLPELEVLAA